MFNVIVLQSRTERSTNGTTEMRIGCRPNFLFPLLVLVVCIAPAGTADANHDDNLLELNTDICQGDMYTIGQCLNRQNEKADRWLQAIVESYAKFAAANMSAPGENVTSDLVAQLRENQKQFEEFRDAAEELVYRAGYPSDTGAKYEGAKAHFRLTIERARFLLDTCNHPRSMSVQDVADLTVSDWCQSR